MSWFYRLSILKNGDRPTARPTDRLHSFSTEIEETGTKLNKESSWDGQGNPTFKCGKTNSKHCVNQVVLPCSSPLKVAVSGRFLRMRWSSSAVSTCNHHHHHHHHHHQWIGLLFRSYRISRTVPGCLKQDCNPSLTFANNGILPNAFQYRYLHVNRFTLMCLDSNQLQSYPW